MGARGLIPGALLGLRPQAVAVSLKRFRVPYLCVVALEVVLPEPCTPFVVEVEVVTRSRGERAPFVVPTVAPVNQAEVHSWLCPRL